MVDFTALLQEHEMGLAYVRITSQMGPSPQLLAFVNYDKIDGDSLGLESLNIMEQHESTLAQLETSGALMLAMEGFSDLVAKTKEKLWKMTSLHLGTNINVLKDHPLQAKKSNHRVIDEREAQATLNIHRQALDILDGVLKTVPRGHDLKAWEAFYATYLKDWPKSKLRETKEKLAALQTEFDGFGTYLQAGNSNWTESNFKKTIGDLSSARQRAESKLEVAEEVCQSLENTLHDVEAQEKKNIESRRDARASGDHLKFDTTELVPAHVLKAMIEVHGVVRRAVVIIDHTQVYTLKALNIASTHFSIAK